jgi:hypothetical protein
MNEWVAGAREQSKGGSSFHGIKYINEAKNE